LTAREKHCLGARWLLSVLPHAKTLRLLLAKVKR